jgi:hypothetical protein
MIDPIETKTDPASINDMLGGDTWNRHEVAKIIYQLALRIERIEIAMNRNAKGRNYYDRNYQDRWIDIDEEIRGQ